jgi:hypothetical protein
LKDDGRETGSVASAVLCKQLSISAPVAKKLQINAA